MSQQENWEMHSSTTEEVDLPDEFLRDRQHRFQAQASDKDVLHLLRRVVCAVQNERHKSVLFDVIDTLLSAPSKNSSTF
ncbi:uncharacterized protein METZ01_LOCUS181784 [marine metagenome]|uniref:Uncharacterized protein n=1 Tax=marine metagenome TaxID=408172 RepID=A0A382CS09_9ZZZZ